MAGFYLGILFGGGSSGEGIDFGRGGGGGGGKAEKFDF